jgi:error-prone DNA polymerase
VPEDSGSLARAANLRTPRCPAPDPPHPTLSPGEREQHDAFSGERGQQDAFSGERDRAGEIPDYTKVIPIRGAGLDGADSDSEDTHDLSDMKERSGTREGTETAESGATRRGGAIWRDLIDLCGEIEGFPRHLSIHVGGMLITATPLVDVVPLEWATAPGRVVTQYNKDDIEDLHLIKVDLLGLRTLSVVHDALALIEERWSIRPDLDQLTPDDPAVYRLLQAADSIGVFQVESRAQSQTLPKMQPRCFDDLVAEISIIRPGPIQGQMVHPFLRRRQGLEPVEYLHPLLEPILAETLGVVLYQEQVIKIAIAVAGFAPGEADLFRWAMSGHRSRGAMERIRAKFVAGAADRGVPEEIGQTVFDQLAGFAEFGFCKSHAAAFAKVTYDTAYLKLYYPVELYTAILNNQPMGFYSPSVIVNDAKRHGIAIRPVDINRSRRECRPEGRRAIRIGFKYVAEAGPHAIDRIEAEQPHGPFRSLPDFCRRTRLDRPAVENLIRIGAFDDFGISRRALLWQLGEYEAQRAKSKVQSPIPDSLELPLVEEYSEVDLPALRPIELAAADYEILGLSPEYHVMEFYRDRLREQGVLTADELADLVGNELERVLGLTGPTGGDRRNSPAMPKRSRDEVAVIREGKIWNGGRRTVRVAGLAIVRQAPGTAKEHVFLTLEDETGLINVVLKPAIYAAYRQIIRRDPLLIVEGDLQIAIPPALERLSRGRASPFPAGTPAGSGGGGSGDPQGFVPAMAGTPPHPALSPGEREETFPLSPDGEPERPVRGPGVRSVLPLPLQGRGSGGEVLRHPAPGGRSFAPKLVVAGELAPIGREDVEAAQAERRDCLAVR